MRLVQYPVRMLHDFDFGTSSDNVLPKLTEALIFMELCEEDPVLALSTDFDHVMKSHVDVLLSLTTSYRYSEIGGKEYQKWESLVIEALNYYYDFPIQYSYVWHEEFGLAHRLGKLGYGDHVESPFRYQIPLVTVEGFRRAVSRIDHFIDSKLSVSNPLLTNDLYLESIEYLLRLVKAQKGMDLGDEKFEVVFSRRVKFLKAVIACTGEIPVMTESETLKDLLADRQAAIDLALNTLCFSATCQCFTSDMKYSELETNIEFVILATYTAVASSSKLSCMDDIAVEFWDCILDSILKLLRRHTYLIVQWNDANEDILEHLMILKYFFLDPPEGCIFGEKLKDLQKRTKVTISKQIISIFLSSYDNRLSLDAINGMKETIGHISSACKDICQLSRSDNFGSLDSFLEKMECIISLKINLLPFLKKHHLEKVLEELTMLNYSLSRICGLLKIDEGLEDIWKFIRDVIYQMECILDSLLDSRGPVGCLIICFFDVMEGIRFIKDKVSSLTERNIHSIQGHNVAKVFNSMSSYKNNPSIDEEVVGFVDEEIKILEMLVGGSKHMEVISIVGMPGLGKTTLAKKVYSNQTVADHFYVRSWCYVSQVFHLRDVLIQILKHIKPINSEVSDFDEYRLAEILYKELKQQKYLIIMDDIWDTTAWDDLKRCFPDDNNGSRILLTSRLNGLSLQPKSKIHILNGLTEEESWELLQKKLFPMENCPLEQVNLLTIGREIAKGCKGVPLVVVVVAGLLSDMDPDHWQNVGLGVTSYVVNDSQRQCADLLELSYKNLPYHLKPCYLYVGLFPSDTEISCETLIQLWVAEGFIKRTVRKSLECIAESYLMDLIQRNLIQVAERRSLGGIKTCRVHDLIHDFCLAKGKEEMCLQQMSNVRDAENRQYHHLSYHYDWDHEVEDLSSYKHAYSLLCFSIFREDCLRYIFHNFKFLRVLDLMCNPMGRLIALPDSIGLLIHLRYLAGNFSSVPTSIGNLSNLETLCMFVTGRIHIPHSFFNLLKLRHLHISSATVFDETYPVPVPTFYNLQTLSTILLPESGSMILRMFPSLRKLKCTLVDLQQMNTQSQSDLLSELESLKVTYQLGEFKPYPIPEMQWEFSFPPSIKKLTLKLFRFPWKKMSIIWELPNLEVLNLDYSSFVGEEWSMEDGKFLKLKHLRLRGLNIKRWVATSDHLPCLESLVIQSCKLLEEIPSDLVDVPTLKMIQVIRCKLSVEESAREIYREQLEYGNQEVKILTRDNREYFMSWVEYLREVFEDNEEFLEPYDEYLSKVVEDNKEFFPPWDESMRNKYDVTKRF